ncbi:MAG: carboxylesterase family protein, partial [Myxococcota bacterium]
AIFTCAAIESASVTADASTSNVWRFLFQRRPKVGPQNILARHGLELIFIFGTLTDIPLVQIQQEDLDLSERMMQAWINFATTGDPNNTQTPNAWTAYDAQKDPTWLFDVKDSLKEGVRKDRCTFWKNLTSP